MADWLAILSRTWDLPASTLDTVTEFYRRLAQSFQANAATVHYNRSR
jgi:hypothetical protein